MTLSRSALPSTLQNHNGAYMYPCAPLRGVEREAAAHFTDTLLVVVFQWYQLQIQPQRWRRRSQHPRRQPSYRNPLPNRAAPHRLRCALHSHRIVALRPPRGLR